MKDTQPLNILVVDDLEANLMVYDDLFAFVDARLLKAKSGSEALELLLEHDIGLALIDVHMPEMDGFELAELMRGSKRTSNVPIIFITAGIEDRRRAFQGYDIGAVDFLFKPIEPQILHTKVRVFVELQRQRRELEETLRLNEELLAVVSHDLRNPLNLVTVAVAVLAESADPSVVATARKIERSTRRMATILNDLLDLSRARLGGGIPIGTSDCELDTIAATVVDELRPTAEGTITVKTAGNLHGDWDVGRLQQVLSNLLANALCHGKPSGVVTLTLDGSRSETVQISVHNEGTIPRGVRAKMFEPFAGTATLKRRAKREASAGGATANGSHDGLGLGLYIASEIVRAHGGDIEVHSSDAEGTRFDIRLPRGKHTITA
jgi:two-component system, sensor histidine kinase and response regulator